MANDYFTTKTKQGTWLAASVDGPYFCFEEQDRKDLDATVARARAFYNRVRKNHPQESVFSAPLEFPIWQVREIQEAA